MSMSGLNTDASSTSDIPSSPPTIAEYASVVEQRVPSQQSSPYSRSLQTEISDPGLPSLSPEISRLLPPRTPARVHNVHSDTSSNYYTAAWGSPYQLSPTSQSARTAFSVQAPSDELHDSSPGPVFSLDHLLPSRLAGYSAAPQSGLSELTAREARPEVQEDNDLTPRSRTKKWVQLPQRQQPAAEKTHWWSEDSASSNLSETDAKQPSPPESPSASSKSRSSGGGVIRGHKPRESNRTLNQQTFWETLREHRSDDMEGLQASKWAASPPPPPPSQPALEAEEVSLPKGLGASKWASESAEETAEETMQEPAEETMQEPAEEPTEERAEEAAEENAEETVQEIAEQVNNDDKDEESAVEESMPSRWADTPPPQKDDEKADTDIEAPRITPTPTADEPTVSQPEEEAEVELEPTDEAVEPAEVQKEIKEPATDRRMNGSTEEQNDNVYENGSIPLAPLQPEDRALAKSASPDPESAIEKTTLAPPRLKKRVSWRGRNCNVSIPDLDYPSLGLRMPMDPEDFQIRLLQFEQEGYNIQGFDLGDTYTGEPNQAYVRAIFPDDNESRAQVAEIQPTVLLPDLNKWKAYEDALTEAKLAALGVSIGPPELEPEPQSSQGMSRQSSAQYPPLPFSPPLPTASAGSMGPPGRPGMIRGHSHTMSVASPISPLNGPFGHMHRHSTFHGPNSFFPQQPQPQAQQHPGMPGLQAFSPAPQLAQHDLARVGSPALMAALRNEMGNMRGPGSPLAQQMLPHTPHQFMGSPFEQPRSRGHSYSQSMVAPPSSFTPQLSQPPSLRPTPALPDLQEAEDEEEEEDDEPTPEEREAPAYVPPQKRAQYNADIAVPSPKGHRHNISESLERDVMETERRQKRGIGHISDVEPGEQSETFQTNAERDVSLSEKDPLGGDSTVKETQHRHKKTMSRTMNASAPSFTFNPMASFTPQMQDFTPQVDSSKFTSTPLPQHAKNQRSIGHIRNTSSGSFNPSAAVFRPTTNPPSATSSTFSFPPQQAVTPLMPLAPAAQAPPNPPFSSGIPTPQAPADAPFKFGASPAESTHESTPQPKSAVSNGAPTADFSFTARRPDSKPAPTAFEHSSSDDRTTSPIFGNVEISDMIKPAKKSKAVAIVKPKDDSPVASDAEDEDGRAMPSSERTKRTRQFGRDGDSVPQFAEPTPEPQLPLPQPEQMLGSNIASSPVRDTAGEVDDTADVETPESDVEMTDRDAEPVNAQVKEAESVEKLGEASPERETKKSLEPNAAELAVQAGQAVSHSQQNSSLSALAKPFAMPNFDASASDTEAGAKTENHQVDTLSELEEGEIQESEASPIASPQPGLQMPVTDVDPSFDEIDAVMRQMNEAEAADGPPQLSPLPSPDFQPAFRANSFHWTVGASERGISQDSPEWLRAVANKPKLESPLRVKGQEQPAPQPPQQPSANGWPPVHRLNNPEDVPMSDWSGMLSTPGEDRLRTRSNFFDSHIETVIGKAIAERLQPLEDSLRIVQAGLSRRNHSVEQTPKRGASSTIESDADDEEDGSEGARQRPISRGKDKRLEQMKAIMLEALREQGVRPSQTYHDIADLHSALADIKVSFARAASANLELDDIREIVKDAIQTNEASKQSARGVPTEEEHRRQLSAVEGRLNETLAGALEEANHRHAAEEREAESRRLLRLAEEELQLLRETYRDGDSRLQALEDERTMLIERAERAEDSRQNAVDERDELGERLEKMEEARQRMEDDRDDLSDRLDRSEDAHRRTEDKLNGFEAENEAMQATLEEYRLSSGKWRQEIEDGKQYRDELEDTIANLESKLEEGQESVAAMKRRLEKIHTDMANAAGQVVSEKAIWKGREAEYRRRCEALDAQRSANTRERTLLEDEVRILRSSATELSETKIVLDHTRNANLSLEEVIRKSHLDLSEQQALAARWERDFNDAREAGRAEVQRTRMAMETDIETANHQVNIVRAELEGEVTRVRAELDNVRMEMDTAKARHDMLLEESEDVRRDALRKVNHTNSVALDEARQKHDTALQDLTIQHSRTLAHAVEDRKRSDIFYQERLSLAEEKLRNEKDRVALLEERLDVAKLAAQAAVKAQTKPAQASSGSTGLPEKISPQALRESILVLQEQLQERETTIERLQSQTSSNGKDATTQLKERDTEIGWLRELLAVRHDDLSELVNTLMKPSFDRDAVRNAAIRISANLQMEQQEKERVSGSSEASKPGQAFASLSNFAAPKLTSAFNNWRNSMESSSLRHAPSRARVNLRQTSSTPSRASPKPGPSSFLNGLMTPPASNIRRSPSPQAPASLPAPKLHSRTNSKQSNTGRQLSTQEESLPDLPTTPTLFHKQTYDDDAENNNAHLEGLEDEDLDIEDSEPPAFRSLEDEMEGGSYQDEEEEEGEEEEEELVPGPGLEAETVPPPVELLPEDESVTQ
ncbi:hypothetical protein K431DRAFT_293283 [Polychaeton citri CBS 116435]|uniref:Uncharacterized protein n=1 Tax=Polychaeton citri CBS 116435 TaxID=1314669 RepID=A0A9P4QBF4_9PEZI|nr:hypothetical protein K431DRAFT_293283 [Polychaeton citri CBS 116435]